MGSKNDLGCTKNNLSSLCSLHLLIFSLLYHMHLLSREQKLCLCAQPSLYLPLGMLLHNIIIVNQYVQFPLLEVILALEYLLGFYKQISNHLNFFCIGLLADLVLRQSCNVCNIFCLFRHFGLLLSFDMVNLYMILLGYLKSHKDNIDIKWRISLSLS